MLFAAAGLQARELRPDEVPQLQAFFEANPEYFQTVNGRPPHADEAQVEFDERPPAHLGHSRNWCLGLFDADGHVAGVAVVVADLCAPRVWHLALYIVATALHGQGVAQPLFEALQAWVRSSGADWLRLGVVRGNGRAERFWRRNGFTDVREHPAVDTGGRVNAVRMMVKPLAGGSLEQYLALVPRDRPGSALP